MSGSTGFSFLGYRFDETQIVNSNGIPYSIVEERFSKNGVTHSYLMKKSWWSSAWGTWLVRLAPTITVGILVNRILPFFHDSTMFWKIAFGISMGILFGAFAGFFEYKRADVVLSAYDVSVLTDPNISPYVVDYWFDKKVDGKVRRKYYSTTMTVASIYKIVAKVEDDSTVELILNKANEKLVEVFEEYYKNKDVDTLQLKLNDLLDKVYSELPVSPVS